MTEKTSQEQRRAISDIAYGRAGGGGPFTLFSQTMRYVLDPQFVPIEMTVAGKKSRFAIPNVLEVSLASFTDPVLGRGARRRGASAEGIYLARRARRADRGNENPDAESALRSLGQERLLLGCRISGPLAGEALGFFRMRSRLRLWTGRCVTDGRPGRSESPARPSHYKELSP